VITLLQQVLAALLVALSNAAALRNETLLSAGSKRLLDRVRSRSPVLTADRRLDHDLRHLTEEIDAGEVCTGGPSQRQGYNKQ
jgi:histidine ammonia-lyase